jgi:hypothetical protein
MLKLKVVAVVLAVLGAASAVWGYAQQRDSGAAVLTAQDFVEIQQLYASLARGLDTADANGYAFARNFVPDGVQGSLVGQKALAEFAQNWHDKRNGANVRHSTSNLLVTRTPEGATVTAYLLMLNVEQRPATIFGTASEEDALVKTSDGWRFKQRTIRSDAGAPR